ncbi:MAG: RCC1 repeat-containing protein [Chloroflexi bacterium]|nr:RCC1 repeat-containing protein [Chloroflexota bacterium]
MYVVHPRLRMFSRLAAPVMAVAGLLVALFPPPAASGQAVPTVSLTPVATITVAATVAATSAPVATPTLVASDVTAAPTGTPVPSAVSSVTAWATGTPAATASASTTVTTVPKAATTSVLLAASTPPQGLVTYVQTDALGPDAAGPHGAGRGGNRTVTTYAMPTPGPAATAGTVRRNTASTAVRFTSLATGSGHTCGLTASGEAHCWGYNGAAQLGQAEGWKNGGSWLATSPQPVSGGITFQSIVAGAEHNCGLGSASPAVAYCWGTNWDGRLGDGTSGNGSSSANRSSPVPVSGGKAFTSLYAGGSVTCGLTDAGKAWCWGRNSYGQLGDGTTNAAITPVAGAPALSFATLTVGFGDHTCGVTTAGPTYCWGGNWYGQLGNGNNSNSTAPVLVQGGLTFTRIASGDSHTCGLTAAGAAYCWGSNQYGQIGDGGWGTNSSPALVGGGLTLKGITAGALHTCGVTTTNIAYCWGSNSDGQLGDGSVTIRRTPVQIAGATAFASLAAGTEHTCGLTLAGLAMCWGHNEAGKLGDDTSGSGSTSPVTVSTDVKFGSIFAGGRHNCGISLAGGTYCWGWNDSNQVGDGTTTSRSQPVAVGAGLGLTTLALGWQHTCGLSATGAAYCWGANGNGQLGGHRTDPLTPSTVSGGQAFVGLVAGIFHTCGLTAGGDAWCWGSNNMGEVGRPRDDTPGTTYWAEPAPVSGSLKFANLAAGQWHTCGVTTAGDAYCWGANWSGQVGDGTKGSNRDIPTRVSGSTKFSSIAAGDNHTCALATTGAAYCWGDNGGGQLGDNTYTSRTSPAQVASNTTFARIASRGSKTCGWTMTATPEVYCWGRTVTFESYRSTSSSSISNPTLSSNHSSLLSAVIGGMHECGTTASGTATCWGNRRYGQLGDGTFGYKTTPVLVAGQIEPWSPGTAPTLSLTTGWNHVAIGTYQASALTAEDVCQAINTANGSGTMVEFNRWVNGGWEGHICGLPPNTFTLERYTGYFIKLSRNAIWTPPA